MEAKHQPKQMKGSREIRPFFCKHRNRWTASESDRVIEWQSHPTSTPYTGGWSFLIAIFNKFPLSLCLQWDKRKQKIKGKSWLLNGMVQNIFCKNLRKLAEEMNKVWAKIGRNELSCCWKIGGLPICQLSTFLYTKFKIKRGPFNDKNCCLMYLGPQNVGRFRQLGVLANWPKLNLLWILITFSSIKSEFKWGIFYEKIAIACN